MRKLPDILRPGDHVAFVAPGSTFSREKFELGQNFVRELGLIPVHGPFLFSRDFIFAGTVAERVKSLRAMLKRKEIKALWCVRGGSGSYAVAQELARDPKPLSTKIVLGMSDITALHILFTQKWKWPVLHGPLLDRIGTPAASPEEQEVLRQTLFNADYRLKLNTGLQSVGKKTSITAPLVGGNLTLLATSLGSRWEIETKNKILFLEEVGERAYRIERMLTQLKSAGKFKELRGVVIGDFTDCLEVDNQELWPTVIQRHFKGAPFPVVTGVHSGHGDVRLTLPLGVDVRINGGAKPSFEVVEGYARG